MATIPPPPPPPPATTSSTSQPPAPSTTTQTAPPTKTPVTLHPTAHLDPSAYVRGPNSITVHKNVLIHPRAHLLSLHSALTIHEGSIISEKVVLGGPLPLPPPAPSHESSEPQGPTPPPPPPPPSSQNPTIISANTHIHPNVTILSGARIEPYAILESNVTVGHDVTVGAHSKVCAGTTVVRNVPSWVVVYGGGEEMRWRSRRTRRGGRGQVLSSSEIEDEGEGGEDPVETARLVGMVREREATMAILKKAAARALASKGRR